MSKTFEVAPSAARLTTSMRDIGYDFVTAIADLVDNSLAAGADQIRIDVTFEGKHSHVAIIDNGSGMDPQSATESLRFGSKREYQPNELGRFGLGLKTASLSQCRRITVLSHRHRTPVTITRTLDLDHVIDTDSWIITEGNLSEAASTLRGKLSEQHGTIVLWEKLDRILPERMESNGYGRRRLTKQAAKLRTHLAMVFHRFLDGSATGSPVEISINGETVEPWDPFARAEPGTEELPPKSFDLESQGTQGTVGLQRFILPPKKHFSSSGAFEAASGPLKWNRQQGIYIYRANRLIQAGGWNGMRAMDEHTKLARAAIDFTTDLDPLFNVNVAKMRISLPSSLKPLFERPIHKLCMHANATYRRHSGSGSRSASRNRSSAELSEIGLAIRTAALGAGYSGAAIRDLESGLRDRLPADVSESLWGGLYSTKASVPDRVDS